MKKSIVVLALLLGASLASPLLYTSQSVYNSAFCQNQKCKFIESRELWDAGRGETYKRFTYQLPGGRLHITRDLQNQNITGVWFLVTQGNLSRGSEVGVAAMQAFLGVKLQASDLLDCWKTVNTADGDVFYGDDTTKYGAKCFLQNGQRGFRIFANN